MSKSSRIIKHIKSSIVGYLALFLMLSGTAYAADTVFSTDIVDGEVKSVDVADNGLTGVDVANGSLTGTDVANDTLTGVDVADNTIASADVTNNSLSGVDVADNTIASADVTNNSLSGADVADNTIASADVTDNTIASADVTNNSLTGTDIAESTLSVQDMGCQTGKVRGSARIKGNALIPNTYTTASTAIDLTNNCSGLSVSVRRGSAGVYFVRFSGNPAALAVVAGNQDGASSAFSGDTDNVVSVGKVSAGADAGSFRVDVQDIDANAADGHKSQDGKFTIMLP
jgi:hypothetical protein